jgi:hypothetical protein
VECRLIVHSRQSTILLSRRPFALLLQSLGVCGGRFLRPLSNSRDDGSGEHQLPKLLKAIVDVAALLAKAAARDDYFAGVVDAFGAKLGEACLHFFGQKRRTTVSPPKRGLGVHFVDVLPPRSGATRERQIELTARDGDGIVDGEVLGHVSTRGLNEGLWQLADRFYTTCQGAIRIAHQLLVVRHLDLRAHQLDVEAPGVTSVLQRGDRIPHR